MASYQHDPLINYNVNLLKQAGGEQYTSGRNRIEEGQQTLNPAESYFRRLLSGDQNELMSAVAPEIDNISSNFAAVRRMIADQPRGGGKTSVLAQLPVQQAQSVSNLISGARRQAPEGLQAISNARTGAGIAQMGQGLNAAGTSASLGLYGRQQDIQNSWKTFFKQLGLNAAQGLGEAIGFGIKPPTPTGT